MKKSNLILCAFGSLCGFLLFKHGKQLLNYVVFSVSKSPIEGVAKEIKDSFLKNMSDFHDYTEKLNRTSSLPLDFTDIANESL